TQVASILEQTATRPTGSGWTPATGWGTLNAKAAVESASGRTVADAAGLSKLTASRPRLPGSRAAVRVYARWNGGEPLVVGALPSCGISIRGATLRAITSLEHGVVNCTFTLPDGSAGAVAEGAVSLTAPAARRALASFRFAVGKA